MVSKLRYSVVAASEAKNQFGQVLESALRDGGVVITNAGTGGGEEADPGALQPAGQQAENGCAGTVHPRQIVDDQQQWTTL